MDAWEQVTALGREGIDAVVITITAVRGSVPGQVGGKAVVAGHGLVFGNLGGGKVEAKAVETAIAMLSGEGICTQVTWNLQRDVGMTCGGEMSFLFERVSAIPPWHIAVFGAGHVAQALVPVLATLACRIDVIDTRADWLEKFIPRANLKLRLVDTFEAGIDLLTAGSFVLSITKGHSSDLPVLREVLRRFPEIAFVGAIGSASKRAILLRGLRDEGLEDKLLEKIVCPIGLPIGGNDPAEIAISIAAQLLAERDRRARPSPEK
jgi:xanthine dehydrogenase accessory factor